jgi:N utilization substance protein B
MGRSAAGSRRRREAPVADRRRARRIALQVLYQLDVAGEVPGDTHRAYVERRAPKGKARDFAWALVEGCHAHQAALDALIAAHARNWSLKRMAPVDRNILRLGAYELLHVPQTPPTVAIDEAVELAKRYGQEESGAFVNAILDAIRKDRPAAPGLPAT